MYVKAINGQIERFPYSATDLIRDNPSTSFPDGPLSDEMMAGWGVYPVAATPQPNFDPRTQKVIQDSPVFNGQAWEQRWSVVQLAANEVTANDAAQAAAVRERRNQELKDSDWTQVADAPVDKAAWAAYRQQLRDISAQPGFPWDVQWPEMPA